MQSWDSILKKEELRQEEQDKLEVISDVLTEKYDKLISFDEEIQDLKDAEREIADKIKSQSDKKSSVYRLQTEISDLTADLKDAKETIREYDSKVKESKNKYNETKDINPSRAKTILDDEMKTINANKKDADKIVLETPKNIEKLKEELKKTGGVGKRLNAKKNKLLEQIKEKKQERLDYLQDNPQQEIFRQYRKLGLAGLKKEINRINTILQRSLILEDDYEEEKEIEEEVEEIEEVNEYHKELLLELTTLYNTISITLLQEYVKGTLIAKKDEDTGGVYRNSAGRLEIADYESLIDIPKSTLVAITNALSIRGNNQNKLTSLINLNKFDRGLMDNFDNKNNLVIDIPAGEAEEIIGDFPKLKFEEDSDNDKVIILDLNEYLEPLKEIDSTDIPVDDDNVPVQEILAQYLYIVSGGKLNINKKREDIDYRDNMKGLLESFTASQKSITNVNLKKLLETAFKVEKDSTRLSNSFKQETRELQELLESEKNIEFFQGDKFRKYAQVLLEELSEGLRDYMNIESSTKITQAINAFFRVVKFNFNVENEKILDEVDKLNTEFIKNNKQLKGNFKGDRDKIARLANEVSSYQTKFIKIFRAEEFNESNKILDRIKLDLKELKNNKNMFVSSEFPTLYERIKEWRRTTLSAMKEIGSKMKKDGENYIYTKEDEEYVLTPEMISEAMKNLGAVKFPSELFDKKQKMNAKILETRIKIKQKFRQEIMKNVDFIIKDIVDNLKETGESKEESYWDLITNELDEILVARVSGKAVQNIGLYGTEREGDKQTGGILTNLLKDLVDENKKFKREHLNITQETRTQEKDGKTITGIYDTKSAEDVANEMTIRPEQFKKGVEMFAQRVKLMTDFYANSSEVMTTTTLIRQELEERKNRISRQIKQIESEKDDSLEAMKGRFEEKLKLLENIDADKVLSDRALKVEGEDVVNNFALLNQILDNEKGSSLSNAMNKLDRELGKLEEIYKKLGDSGDLSIKNIKNAMPALT